MENHDLDIKILLRNVRSIKRMLWVALSFIVFTCVGIVSGIIYVNHVAEKKANEYLDEFDKRMQIMDRDFEKAQETKDILREEARLDEALDELENAKYDKSRFYALTDIAFLSGKLGRYDDAERYSKELLKMASNYRKNWNYGNAIHKGNLALGFVALARNDPKFTQIERFQ